MNSERAKELRKLQNSALFCRHSKRRGIYSSGGKFYRFFVTVALAVPPLTMKNRPMCLFGHVRLIGRIR